MSMLISAALSPVHIESSPVRQRLGHYKSTSRGAQYWDMMEDHERLTFSSRTGRYPTFCILSLFLAVTFAGSINGAHSFPSSCRQHRRTTQTSQPTSTLLLSQLDDWSAVEDLLQDNNDGMPKSIDSALVAEPYHLSTNLPTLFRERHGWCPYSERVWLMLELAQTNYDTVRIDNMGGPRPRYYAGQTPQMKWPDGHTQGESMDLVCEIDERYLNNTFGSDEADVQAIIRQFSSIFPRARPSSRAAFLFQMSGEPLWKSTFQETLQKTDELLRKTKQSGPYFCGSELTVADVAWAPFLERYRYQLPCLHEGLDPADADVYPHLAKWYAAMDHVPEYVCRIKGDASSWRKVLTMAGFGNSGLPSQIQSNMDALLAKEEKDAIRACQASGEVWDLYARDRSYIQSSPSREAVSTITRNRNAIVGDALKQATRPSWKGRGLPESAGTGDATLLSLVQALLVCDDEDGCDSTKLKDTLASEVDAVRSLAIFLDERMCVPRDMGVLPAATIKKLAIQLR